MRWCSQAELRSKQIESGLDLTFSEVFLPIYLGKVRGLRPHSLLEVGSGTGHLSLALKGEVPNLTSIEPSQGMFQKAVQVLEGSGVKLMNCTAQDLPKSGTYDMVISHLVAHVVHDLRGFLASIREVLEKGGVFVFSVPHPCFYNEYKRLFALGEYQYMTEQFKEISFSITNDPSNKIEGVPYHHRPLSGYFSAIRNAGLFVSGFEEIFPCQETQEKYGALWNNPRYCLFACSVR